MGLRQDVDYVVTDRFWTVPNLITLIRFCLVPVFVWLTFAGQYLAAFIVLAVLGSTDWVDGYVARRFNQISRVGQWLDPVADRLSLIVVAVTLFLTEIAPWWLAVALLVPDLILAITALILFNGSPELEVSAVGKIRTAFLLAGTPALLLAQVPGLAKDTLTVIAYCLLIPGVLGHLWATASYLVGCAGKHRELKARGIDPRNRAAWAVSSQGASVQEASTSTPTRKEHDSS